MSESRKVWKFFLASSARQYIGLPRNAEILSVQKQDRNICLWVLVEPKNNIIPRAILMIGTGHDIPDDTGRFIGTVQMAEGALVWHYFEGQS